MLLLALVTANPADSDKGRAPDFDTVLTLDSFAVRSDTGQY